LHKKGSGERHRGTLDFTTGNLKKLPRGQREFWSAIHAWALSDYFASIVLGKFPQQIAERRRREFRHTLFAEVRLNRDKVNYALEPHTDARNRVSTVMFYLARDHSLADHGTAIYRPKQTDFRDLGGGRNRFGDLELVAKAPFLPNTGLGFLKSDYSFHGVEPVIGDIVQRDILSVSIRSVAESLARKIKWLAGSTLGIENRRRLSL
jgi:hypothetical protein